MDGCLGNRRKLYQVIDPTVGPTTGTWRCQVHRGCIHNESTGIMGRVLGCVPKPSATGIRRLKIGIRRIVSMLRARREFERMEYGEILEQYSGAKRTKYETAARELGEGPVEKRDARVTGFIKAEKRKEEDEKDPRVIQFRTPKYNLELATYLKPVEHALLGYRGPRRGLVERTFVIAKGRDTFERASLIKRKFDQFGDCVCVSLDASRFDKHVSEEALRLEHSAYNSIWNDPYLARLLSWQVSNKCRTMGGIKYKVKGNRMSGDYNTGMGNCLLVAGMTEEFLRSLKLDRWDYFADSDDCLVFVERHELKRLLETVTPYFLEFGQEVRIEKVAHEYWDVNHCQASPLATAGGVRMIRDWRKVVSQAFCGYNHYHQPKGGMRVMKSVAQCELILNAGVPILQPLSQRILHLLESQRFSALDMRDTVVWLAATECRRRHFDWMGSQECPITPEARASFERVFGLTKEQQIAWETWIGELTFENIDLSRMVQEFPPVDQGFY